MQRKGQEQMNLPSFDGSAGDIECARLAELATGKTVLELGTLVGRSTIAMARTAEHVTTVDDHTGADTLSLFLGNLDTYEVKDKVTPIIGRTENVVPLLTETFGMAFIDADHSYGGALRDLWNVNRVVEPGGVIACHDYLDLWELHYGVAQAVDEFCTQTDWRIVETVHSMVVLRQGAATDYRGDAAAARLSELLGAIRDPALAVSHACPGARCKLCGQLELLRGVA